MACLIYEIVMTKPKEATATAATTSENANQKSEILNEITKVTLIASKRRYKIIPVHTIKKPTHNDVATFFFQFFFFGEGA